MTSSSSPFSFPSSTIFLALIGAAAGQYYTATYTPSATGLPQTTENGQAGTNNCGTANSQTSMCQNFYINDITDFCLWAPPNGGEVAQFEATEVSYCTKAGRGTRLIPPGTITGAHFVRTPSYVQVTGVGDFTKIGITPGDQGGELDPHGATGEGNPVGGLVFHNGVQMHEWFSFMSADSFCTRACYDGNRATSLCRHTYDVLGCGFNAPGNYDANVFETCDGADARDIMYGYPGLSTFVQDDTSRGVAVPSPHPAPASSNCVTTTAGALGGNAAVYGASASSTSSTTSNSTTTTASSSSTAATSSTTTTSSGLSSSSSSSIVTSMTTSTVSSPFGNGSGFSSSSPSSNAASAQGNAGNGATSLLSLQTTLPVVLLLGAMSIFAVAV